MSGETRTGPVRVGDATFDAILESDGRVRIQFACTIASLPWYGATFHWTGADIQDVSCELSSGDRPVLRRRRNQIGLVVPRASGGKTVSVKLTYTLRLETLFPGDDVVRVLQSKNLPLLKRASRFVRAPSSFGDPQTIVRVIGQAPEVVLFGPEYPTNTGSSSSSESTFGFFDMMTPLTVIVGRFARKSNGTPVFIPLSQVSQLPSTFIREVGDCASKVRDYYREIFGAEPTPVRGVVPFCTQEAPSRCVGSGILINTCEVSLIHDPNKRQAALIALLAHEYAHAWWSYTVRWEDRQTYELVNEMLAIALARDCVQSLKAGLAVDPHSELWNYVSYAVQQRNGRLVRPITTASGAKSATLLIDLLRQRRRVVVSAIQELWNDGRRMVLTKTRLREVLMRHLGESTADALLEAMKHPRPFVAAARLDFTKDRWTITLRPLTGSGDLQRRLESLGYLHPDSATSRIIISVPQKEDLMTWTYSLELLHVVFGRTNRLIMIYAHSWLRRLWRWASTSKGSVIRATVAVILNSEDPAGWYGFSRALEKYAPILSRRFALAAARRALYEREAHLREELVGRPR